MRLISAVDSVSLAIQRTRYFLFRPFRWGTYLKLGLVAIITEGIGSNSGSSKHGGPSPGHGPIINSPFDIPPVWIAAAVAAVRRWRFKPAMMCGKPVAGGVYIVARRFELGD